MLSSVICNCSGRNWPFADRLLSCWWMLIWVSECMDHWWILFNWRFCCLTIIRTSLTSTSRIKLTAQVKGKSHTVCYQWSTTPDQISHPEHLTPPYSCLPFFPSSFLITIRCPDIDFSLLFLSPVSLFFSSGLSLSHFFSSISVITSICFLHHPALSLPPRSFSFPISPSSLVVTGRPPLSWKFSQPPHPLIFHQPFSDTPHTPPHRQHTHTHTPSHTHTHTTYTYTQAAISPFIPSLSSLPLSVRGTNAFVQYLQQTD